MHKCTLHTYSADVSSSGESVGVDVRGVACGGRIRCPAAYDTEVVLLALHGATFQSDVWSIPFLPSSSEGETTTVVSVTMTVYTLPYECLPWAAQIRFDFLDLSPPYTTASQHRDLNTHTLPSHLTPHNPHTPPNVTLLSSHPSLPSPLLPSLPQRSVNIIFHHQQDSWES
jgi:hypothetical protein